MKKINFKKTICASLAALAICPAIAAVKPAVNTYAATAFVSGNGNGAGTFTFDESQITVESSTSRAFGTYVNAQITEDEYGGDVISYANNTIAFPKLTQSTIILRISGKNINTITDKQFEKTKLDVTCGVDNVSNTHSYVPSVVRKSNDYCELVYNDVFFFGDLKSFATEDLPNISDLKCNSALIESNLNHGYYYLDVKAPGGENLYIRLRKDDRVAYNNIVKWAKNLCIYANALSKTTGEKLGTLYICYDYPTEYGGFSSKDTINKDGNSHSFIAICKTLTDGDIVRLNTGKDEITCVIAHEMSHSYGCNSGSAYDNNFHFWRFITPDGEHTDNWDEFVTKIRALTAIQNCSNLRNKNIFNDDYSPYGVSDTYDKIMEYYSGNDLRYQFEKKLAALGNENGGYGWTKLEEYFSAKTDNDYASNENKQAAKAMNELLGTSCPFNNLNKESHQDYLKFVNSFRKLYKVMWGGSFSAYSFKSFIAQKFGTEFVLSMYNYLRFFDVK
ncbi:MAG: hypothetical protein GXY08_04860 [Ruminococcus sp.]|nr:hypothetical protein [Ruminococcus sp.]